MDSIWQRVLDGRNVAVIGAIPEPPGDASLLTIRVTCDERERPLGALLEAKERADHLTGLSERPRLEGARQRVLHGLRKRLLGEMVEREPGAVFVEALNRLAKQERRKVVVVLESLESADTATLQVLGQIVLRSGWLRVPLLLQFQSDTMPSSARALLDTVRQVEGETAVHRRLSVAAESPSAAIIEALPLEVRRVLRAAATVGEKFEAALVAALLQMSTLDVIYLLQVARDAGVPLSDLGEGRFRLPTSVVALLGAELMPSLSSAWHRRLARLLADRARPAAARPRLADIPAKAAAPRAASAEPAAASAPRHEMPPPVPVGRAASPSSPYHAVPTSSPYHAVPTSSPYHAVPTSSPYHASPSTIPPRAPSSTPPPGAIRESAPPQRGQPSRAARHAEAAGEVDLAVEQYVAASHEAALHGAHREAAELARKALDLLGDSAPTSHRRLLRIGALMELARVKWESALPGEASGLGDALELLGECKARLLPDDPVELGAEVAVLRAGVCYDIGDKDSLTLALEELGQAAHALLDAGRPFDAARLLNEEAAVWVRAGDPVRAHHLLEKSRSIFQERAEHDPRARTQLAETDHLLARLVLHAPPRPGHEVEAVDRAIEHARRAEKAFEALGRPREVGRVWETLGRLEMLAARPREAMEHLVHAADIQQQVADVLGLARTSAALAEIARHAGDFERALGLLAGSIELNLEKGSPLGLAFNRKALSSLVRELGREQRDALEEDFTRVVSRLEAAERVLGRAELPPDLGSPA